MTAATLYRAANADKRFRPRQLEVARTLRFADPELARMAKIARDLDATMGQPLYYDSVINAGAPYQTASGSALQNSSVLTDVSPGGNTTPLVVPYSYYQQGSMFELEAMGFYSTTGTPTLLIGFYYGAVAGTALCATVATTTGSGVSNLMWHARAIVTVRTLGTSGAMLAFGLCHGIAATASTPVLMPASSASGNSVTVNTTTNNAWTVGAQWGTSNASNTLTCTFFSITQKC